MSRSHRPIRSRIIAAAQGVGVVAATLACVAAVPAQARYGVMPESLVKLTNSRYDHNCFWGGPRGVPYASLPGAQPIQMPNLYPDVGATYFVGQFELPAGASLDLAGRFPYARYVSYAIQTKLADGSLGAGDLLRDNQIVPDRGSTNPFIPSNPRDARKRSYAIRVVGGSPLAQPATNTLYTGSTGPTDPITMVLRTYIPDQGRDGTGDAGLPKFTLRLADGQTLQGPAACSALTANKDQGTGTLPVSIWKSLIAGSSDPAEAPVPYPAQWQRFWNVGYSVFGSFITNPVARAKKYPPTDDGGFASNPDTRYLTSAVSLRYGKVYTVSARMPSFPSTYAGTEAHEPYRDVRYWSACTGSAPTSGIGYDCVFDQQVALRGGRYTLVVSKPADRPANATAACGYTWLNFGKGEDNPDGTGRPYIDFMYMRFMAANPHWPHAPQDVKTPGTVASVMGPYFPRGAYTSVKAFERRGCTHVG